MWPPASAAFVQALPWCWEVVAAVASFLPPHFFMLQKTLPRSRCPAFVRPQGQSPSPSLALARSRGPQHLQSSPDRQLCQPSARPLPIRRALSRPHHGCGSASGSTPATRRVRGQSLGRWGRRQVVPRFWLVFGSAWPIFVKPALRGTPDTCIPEPGKAAENDRKLLPSLTPGSQIEKTRASRSFLPTPFFCSPEATPFPFIRGGLQAKLNWHEPSKGTQRERTRCQWHPGHAVSHARP